MAEAPKIPQIVRERLRVQQAGVWPGEAHPDADMLTAFSENTLASREHSLVTSHLASCTSCRDIVMLAQSVAAEAGGASSMRVSRAPGWMAFRWAALAACFVLTVGVVWFERSSRLSPAEYVAPPAPSSAPAAPASNDLSAKMEAESTTAALPARNEKPVDKNFGREKRDRAQQRLEAYGYADMKANSVGRPFDGTKNNGARGKVGRLEQTLITKEEDSVHDSSTAPPIVFDRMSEMNRASSARAATGGIVGGPVAQARASAPAEAKGNSPHAPPPPSATAAASPSAASTAGTLGKLSSAAPSEERQNGRSGQVSGEVAAASEANEAAFGDQSAGARLNGQEPGKKKLADENVPVTAPARARRVLPRDDKQAVAQSLASSPSAASSNFSVEAKDQSDALIAGTAKLATASPTPMQWRIRGGKLQQSNDEGKTWREVNIPSPVSLRAFWSLGSSVWAGGTQGSLFRVTDDGKKSVRIPIKTGEGEVSQTVVAVTFSDELHGIITLENGQILQTADGGKTWERH